jgi:hypothetical protein
MNQDDTDDCDDVKPLRPAVMLHASNDPGTRAEALRDIELLKKHRRREGEQPWVGKKGRRRKRR